MNDGAAECIACAATFYSDAGSTLPSDCKTCDQATCPVGRYYPPFGTSARPSRIPWQSIQYWSAGGLSPPQKGGKQVD